MWVDGSDIADDLISEFELGIERAQVLRTFNTRSASKSYDSLIQVSTSVKECCVHIKPIRSGMITLFCAGLSATSHEIRTYDIILARMMQTCWYLSL